MNIDYLDLKTQEVKKIDSNILKQFESINWQDIVDMRNVLAHDYRGVDLDIVFAVVKVELPILKKVFIDCVKLFDKTDIEAIINTKHYSHFQKIIFRKWL